MTETAINLIANYSKDTICDKLNNLNNDDLIDVLTWIKLPPRIFKLLDAENQKLFIENNIYLRYNFGCMHNYLNLNIIENDELKTKLYGRTVDKCLEENKLSYLTSTPLSFYQYSIKHPEIWNKINKSDYCEQSFSNISKQEQKIFARSYIATLLIWMMDIDDKIFYELIVSLNRFNSSFKYIKLKDDIFQQILNKIINHIQPNQFDWIYKWLNTIMTIQQETFLLNKLSDWYMDKRIVFYIDDINCMNIVLIEINKLPYRVDNKIIIDKLKFLRKLS